MGTETNTRTRTKNSPLRVLMVTAEAAPFAKVGGLGDVAGTLPRRLAELGLDVVVVMPFYREVSLRGYEPVDAGRQLDFHRAGESREGRLHHLAVGGVRYWFLKEDRLFDREGVYGPAGGEFPDNPQRFSYLCRGALQACRAMDFLPDIVHCHDWHAALTPLYMKHLDWNGHWDGAKSVLTIHNLAYQGAYGSQILPSLGLPEELFHGGLLEYGGGLNFLKAGIEVADLVTTVSPTYALEIQTPEQGWGLNGILGKRKERLVGVLNGIDYEEWDPGKDPYLKASFTAEDPAARAENRAYLKKQLGLYPDPESPLLAFVGRLVSQKGADHISRIMPQLVEEGYQVVVLGTGEYHIEESLKASSLPFPGRVSLNVGFNDSLARRIYGGADFFLMPSRFEPCGLGQMIAMRYGSVPIVRATGGLVDTVTDIAENGTGNGIVFEGADSGSLLEAVRRGGELYRKGHLAHIVPRIMKIDNSWRRSAGRYADLYARLVRE